MHDIRRRLNKAENTLEWYRQPNPHLKTDARITLGAVDWNRNRKNLACQKGKILGLTGY